MKNKRFILLSIILVIVVAVVVTFLITRPQQQELFTQEFAQLPEKPRLIAEFHNGPKIYSVAFSPTDSSLIASVDHNGTIRLWNINNKKEEIKTLGHPGFYASIGFSPSGDLLASIGGGKLVLWDVVSGTKLNSLEAVGRDFAFSPNGKLATTTTDEVKLWEIRSPEQITELATLPFDEAHKISSWACAVDISQDGKLIAAGYANGSINVWDLKTQKFVKTLKTSLIEMDFLKFSPNTRFMYAGGSEWKNHGAQGYIMWEIPSWQRHGEVLRGNIDNLVFSPNGKVCVSANDQSFFGRGVELWSVENGAPITFLPTQARDAAFSKDGNYLVTGGWDSMVQVWELTSHQLDASTPSTDLVRIIYYLPKDKEPSPNITQRIDKTIREAQDFYADEMERHGFDRKTFSYETDHNGIAKIYLVKEHQFDKFDKSNGILLTIHESKIPQTYPYFYYADLSGTFSYPSYGGYTTKNNIWRDAIKGIIPGENVHVFINHFDRESVAYSLRGAFGVHCNFSMNERNSLKRFFSRVNDMMPWGKKWARLSRCEAEWLDKSRYFNPNQPFFDKRPDIQMSVSPSEAMNTRSFQFDVADEDGIHQVQLFVPINIKSQRWRNKFHDCEEVNGKDKAIVVFELSDPEINNVELRMIDMHGNITSREFRISEEISESEKQP